MPHLIRCKNCNMFIDIDPTDSESYVHWETGDGACNPKKIDAWAEPKEKDF